MPAPGKDERIAALMREVFTSPHWRAPQDLCVRLTRDEDEDVAGLAVTGLGHLARLHGELDLDVVLPVLHELRDTPGPLAGRAEDALDDIEGFLGRAHD